MKDNLGKEVIKMKYEKLDMNSGSKYKWLLCGLILGVGLIMIINTIFSYAKYKSVDSVKLASGTINYESADLNVIAMYKNDGDGTEDIPIEKIPEVGYTFDDTKSYCTIGSDINNKITDIFEYKENKISVTIDTKGTKCYFYFEKLPPTAEDILANLFSDFTTAETGISFSTGLNGVLNVTGADTRDNGNVLYKAEDNDGSSYFFRGQAPNNWVQFANMRWRIIRINGDGTIRMIFQCNGADCTDTTGTETNAESNVAYNSEAKDNTYVGYYYGTQSASSYAETHNGNNPSTIAEAVNSWYEDNLIEYEDFIDQNAGFCNDRQSVSGVNLSYNGTGTGTSPTSYALWGRVYKNGRSRQQHIPTLKCGVSAATAEAQETSVTVNDAAYQRDLFTKKGSNKGNGKLDYPIGLITADEVILAGGYNQFNNSSYYLYTNQKYWTMSPAYVSDYGGDAYVSYVTEGSFSYTGVNAPLGVRPVINLKANTIFESGGEGTIDKPYVVVTD